MKKSKFILMSSIGIFFLATVFAYAAEVKALPNAVKEVTGSANVPAKKVPAQAAPAAAKVSTPVNVKPMSAAANVPATKVPVQAAPVAAKVSTPVNVKPVPAAANVPVQNQAQPAVATDQNKTTPTEVLPVTQAPAYSYNPMDKPDPFKPFIEIEKVAKQKVEKKAPDSIFPLQRAEADSYRVVGIAGTPEKRVAIVEDSAKKFYPLVKGTRIGLYDGKVIEITDDRVVVEEYEDKKARRVILKLRKN